MNTTLNTALASTRERELRNLAHQPDRLMARELELALVRTSRRRSRRRAR